MTVKTKTRPGGFTLIELMLVVAIISVLAAIALPKFANLVVKSKEAAVKGKLGSLRSAFTIYYADNEGFYPPNPAFFQAAFIPKYIDAIPSISIPTVPSHVETSRFAIWPNPEWQNAPGVAGAWGITPEYVPFVWCSHTDSTGSNWSLW